MYCPRCGKENPGNQKFCTSCGLSLQTVSLALSDETQAPKSGAGLIGTVGKGLSGWQSTFVYAGILLIVGLTISTIGHKVLGDKSAADIGTIIALVGVLVLMLKGVFLVLTGIGSQHMPSDVPVHESLQEATQRLLTAEPPTVTEQTTRQLDAALERNSSGSRDTQPTS